MALKGTIEDLSVSDLVKIHCIGRARARVRLTHPEVDAELYFDSGDIVDARYDSVSGVDAVYKALSMSQGGYHVELNATPSSRTINEGWQEILRRWEH